MSVNGQREFANSILVDGVEASSNRNNDTTMRPSVDAIDEFKVLTSGYAAELGRASGAVIAVQSKSGTNRLHGKLTNVAKHSGAKVASVVLVGSDKEIQLTVEDDGVGFDPATAWREAVFRSKPANRRHARTKRHETKRCPCRRSSPDGGGSDFAACRQGGFFG